MSGPTDRDHQWLKAGAVIECTGPAVIRVTRIRGGQVGIKVESRDVYEIRKVPEPSEIDMPKR